MALVDNTPRAEAQVYLLPEVQPYINKDVEPIPGASSIVGTKVRPDSWKGPTTMSMSVPTAAEEDAYWERKKALIASTFDPRASNIGPPALLTAPVQPSYIESPFDPVWKTEAWITEDNLTCPTEAMWMLTSNYRPRLHKVDNGWILMVNYHYDLRLYQSFASYPGAYKFRFNGKLSTHFYPAPTVGRAHVWSYYGPNGLDSIGGDNEHLSEVIWWMNAGAPDYPEVYNSYVYIHFTEEGTLDPVSGDISGEVTLAIELSGVATATVTFKYHVDAMPTTIYNGGFINKLGMTNVTGKAFGAVYNPSDTHYYCY